LTGVVSGRTIGGAVLLAACVWATAMAVTVEPPPTLEDVLRRARAYVTEFEQRLSGIVAEETYAQEARELNGRRQDPMRRTLRSDLLLVKLSPTTDWLQLRDVFEVDGEPVRDRDERLLKLFVAPTRSTEARISTILKESARYNIGSVTRTVNVPVLALRFLEPQNQSRFKFKRSGDRRAPGTVPAPDARFRVSTEVWVVEYEETAPATIIRTNGQRDLPARGRFWIEPDTGRVLMSELLLQDRFIRATIAVSYQSEPIAGMLVPIEMRERIIGRRDRTQIDGTAEYGRFRQFQVTVDEKFAPIRR